MVSEWSYEAIRELIGGVAGFRAASEGRVRGGAATGLAGDGAPHLINVQLGSNYPSPAMRRLAELLGRKVSG
jgi:indolepyruvate decarboxylase